MTEAIRAQDQSMLEEFEKRGGLLCFILEHHFPAAVASAVETENTETIYKLLSFAPSY